MTDKDRIKAACVVVGCKVKDLLVGRIAGEVVVLVVAPVGHKYRVPFSDLAAPPPVMTKVEAKEPPVAASALVKRRPRAKKV